MKAYLLFAFLITGVFAANSMVFQKTGHTSTYPALVTMKMDDVQKLTGRKFSLREKIVFKFYQLKSRKAMKTGITKPWRQADWAFLFSLLLLGVVVLAITNTTGLILLPLFGVLLFLSAFLGRKSFKNGQKNFKAKFALTVAGVVIALTLGILIMATTAF